MEYKKTLIVKATTACNLACPYCYNYKNSLCREDISEKTIDKILKVFKNKIGAFVWHGGEPLLVGKKFFDETNKKIKDAGKDIQICIQTNGVLIDEEFISLFKKYNINISISFDGIHNNRTRKNDEKIFEIFSLLKKHNVPFGCLQIFSDESKSSLIEEYEFAKKHQLNININTVFKANGNELSYNLNAERIVKETCEFFDYWMYDKDNPQPSAYLSKYIKLLLGSRYHLCENTFCVGSWFSISPNGDLYPCGRDWEKDYCFCNINEIDSIEDIYKTSNYKKFLDISKQLTVLCMEKKCPFFTMCSGGCYARHINWIKDSGRFEVEPQYCYAQKKILAYIFNKIKNIGLYSYKKYNPWLIELLLQNRYIKK